MGNLDIGMAMVAARIASSGLGKEQEIGKKREKSPHHDPWRGSDRRRPSLPGVKMEVINGELALIPSGELPKYAREKGWTLTREDGNVIRLDTGEVVQPPASRKNKGLR
ncbi:MAG: hypothetical protein WBB46_01160 [Candidatus Deferrimicrobiaceae bacterium]